MKTIMLTQNKCAIVDDEMLPILKKIKWCAARNDHRNFYGMCSMRKPDGTITTDRLHHFVAGHPIFGFQVDHIDGDGLNNQRSNLRVVTRQINNENRADRRNGTTHSQYLGVTWSDYGKNHWMAYIKGKYIGRFATELEASDAREKVRKEYE